VIEASVNAFRSLKFSAYYCMLSYLLFCLITYEIDAVMYEDYCRTHNHGSTLVLQWLQTISHCYEAMQNFTLARLIVTKLGMIDYVNDSY